MLSTVHNGEWSDLEVEHARLRGQVANLEAELGRAHNKRIALELELSAARQQIAWLSRQLFGPKAERVDSDDIGAAWAAYCAELENASRTAPVHNPATTPASESPLTSLQLLLEMAGNGGDEALDGPSQEQTSPPADETGPTGDARGSEPDASPQPQGPVRATEGGDDEKPIPPVRRKGHGRRPLPETLPTRYIVLEPDEIPDGARRIGEKVSERLGVVPRHLERVVIVRTVYAQDEVVDGHEVTRTFKADTPSEIIPRGRYTPSALAHFITEHFTWHSPWHRLSAKFEQDGFRIAKSTLSGIAVRASRPLAPLVKTMTEVAREVASTLHIDPTSVRFMESPACHSGAAWIRVAVDVGVFVDFSRTLDADTAAPLIQGWSCPMVADGAQIFDRGEKAAGLQRGGCWSHARRKLVYVTPNDPRALVGVKLIGDLFRIEAELLERTPEERLDARNARSAPVVESLLGWRDRLLADPNLPPRSELARALRYLRNQQGRLTLFLRDGRVPIHNNPAELGARHIAVGRKDWLFLGSDAAADAAGIWLTLSLSAWLHDLPPERYLRDLFRVLPQWPQTRLVELAPHNWKATAQRLNRTELDAEFGDITIPGRLNA